MMKSLVSATALTALAAASPALSQGQSAGDPLVSNPPAAMEPAPAMESQPMPMAPEATAPEPSMPQTQADVPTLPSPQDATIPSEQAGNAAKMFIEQQRPGEVLASSLIGSTVEDPSGETLGDINDVVLNDEDIVDGVVIGVGGFLGIGEKNVAVSFDAIERSTDADGNIVLTLNTTAEDLESAPQYVTVAGLRQQPKPEPNSPTHEPTAPATSQ
jgi:sporulation protein YlmC with PRC-barrel domain